MPKDHARKNDLRAIKSEYGITHTEAIAILDNPANQLLCATCGWTMGMECPECPGCGCYTSCSGWRHAEYRADGERDPWEDRCVECGADMAEGSYDECTCD
jgi:hypothetical protein